jgi:hypothetical protein
MKKYSVLALIMCSLFISCKEFKPKEQENVSDIKVDTSYKKNIRLYDQYYYNMSSIAVNEMNSDSIDINNEDYVTITYNKQSINLKKSFTYKNNLLKEVNLSGNSFDGSSILSLLKEKYGEPKVLEEKEKSTHTQVVATKIINMYPLKGNHNGLKYNPAIHKEISNEEFNKRYEDFYFYSGSIANSKLHIVNFGDDTFFKLMKDITKDELVKINIEVAMIKNEYTKTKVTGICTWQDEGKEIQLNYTKAVIFNGNKTPMKDTLYANLNIKFSSSDDKMISPKLTKEIDPSKELEKKSLEAI